MDLNIRIFIAQVPEVAPVTQEQASTWSSKHWPTIYKKHNHFGPQHNIVKNATSEIASTAHEYMRLANNVAQGASKASIGQAVGAVIVERTKCEEGSVVAAAGDARWYRAPQMDHEKQDDPTAHAIIRAIAMVARKRRSQDSQPDEIEDGLFNDRPLTSLEVDLYSRTDVDPSGYLCLDLEIYVTHEPCVMCSMALLHSRFARVIFGTHMPRTGGLVADQGFSKSVPSLGYGLFWRASLNWKMLAWQFQGERHALNDAVSDVMWHA